MPRQRTSSRWRPLGVRIGPLLLLILLCHGGAAWNMLPQRQQSATRPRPAPHAQAPGSSIGPSAPHTRRDALQWQLLVHSLASLLLPTASGVTNAAAGPATVGSALLLGGFQIPADQYGVYAERLREAGLAHVSVRADGNTLGDSAAARVPGPLGEGGEGGVAVGGYEAEALGVVKEIVRAQQQPPAAAFPLLLVGHSRGGALAVRVAHALQQQQAAQSSSSRQQPPTVPRLAGLVLLDPVDYPPAPPPPPPSDRSAPDDGKQPPAPSPQQSSSSSSSPSCLPLLAALRRASPALPVAIAALPYSGVNRYYKSKNTNVCAPPGRDALAFYEAATATNGNDGGKVLLMTVPEAGHLQLLQRRSDLSFAEVCGVGKRFPEAQVMDLCANLVVACAREWVQGDGGDVKERVLGGRDGEGLRPVDPDVAATVVWGK